MPFISTATVMERICSERIWQMHSASPNAIPNAFGLEDVPLRGEPLLHRDRLRRGAVCGAGPGLRHGGRGRRRRDSSVYAAAASRFVKCREASGCTGLVAQLRSRDVFARKNVKQASLRSRVEACPIA